MQEPDYTYKRKDGGTTLCYGTIVENSNFDLVCEDEYNDGCWCENPGLTTWLQLCKFLEANYDNKIEQIEEG